MISIAITDPYFAEKTAALQALYAVIDPELFVNIIDLGLVYDINFTDKNITVTMTLSTPHCPMGESIMNGVKNVLEAEFPTLRIDIELVWQPEWNFGMISEEGKRALGLDE